MASRRWSPGSRVLGSSIAGAGALTAWAAPNYETLVAGRVLYGLAIGFGMHAAPAYISETVLPAACCVLIHSCLASYDCAPVVSD